MHVNFPTHHHTEKIHQPGTDARASTYVHNFISRRKLWSFVHREYSSSTHVDHELLYKLHTVATYSTDMQFAFVLKRLWCSSQVQALWIHYKYFNSAFKSVCLCVCACTLAVQWPMRIVTACVTSCSISSCLLSLLLTSLCFAQRAEKLVQQTRLHVSLYKCKPTLAQWQERLSSCHLSSVHILSRLQFAFLYKTVFLFLKICFHSDSRSFEG